MQLLEPPAGLVRPGAILHSAKVAVRFRGPALVKPRSRAVQFGLTLIKHITLTTTSLRLWNTHAAVLLLLATPAIIHNCSTVIASSTNIEDMDE